MLPRSSSCGETPTSVRASAHTTSFLISDGGSPGTRLRRASTRRVARTFGSASFTGSPSELLDEIGGRGYGHTENRVRLVRMHAQGWASSMLSSSSTMQVKTRALADQACHHPLRQAHGRGSRRQAEQGRSCRVGHHGECQVAVAGDSEQPQEGLPMKSDASTMTSISL